MTHATLIAQAALDLAKRIEDQLSPFSRPTRDVDFYPLSMLEAMAVIAALRSQASALPAPEAMNIDCIGLALDLEAQAKQVGSQTIERAMLAAAQGLRALAIPAPEAGAGEWQMVPREPTEEMIRAALDCQDADPADGPDSEMYYAYRAMLSAAPSQSPQDEKEREEARLRIRQLEDDKQEIRESLAFANAARSEQARDERRLIWAMDEGHMHGAEFVAHVLRRGGTGDIGDCRTFIDAYLKGQPEHD